MWNAEPDPALEPLSAEHAVDDARASAAGGDENVTQLGVAPKGEPASACGRRVLLSQKTSKRISKEDPLSKKRIDARVELEGLGIEKHWVNCEIHIAGFEAVAEVRRARDDCQVDRRCLLTDAAEECRQHQHVEEIGRYDAKRPARLGWIERIGLRDRACEAHQPAAQGHGKRLGARGERHPSTSTHEQRILEELPEPAEGMAHRGLRDTGTLRRPGDASLSYQRVERDEQVGVDASEARAIMNLAHVCIKLNHWIHVNRAGMFEMSHEGTERKRDMTNIENTNNNPKSLRILVVGATGGTGRATIEELVAQGHRVTAFSRRADALAERSELVTAFNGDATNAADLDAAVVGHDAVIVTLGIAENPFRVRLFGTARTPMNVRSAGTRNVVAAMRRHGVRRLVVQSSYGVGETRGKLRFIDSFLFNLLLKPQIADTEVQELEVRRSGVDWVLAQPVHLTDETAAEMPFASVDGEVREWKISRKGVARFLARAAQASDCIGRSVALSGGGAA